MANVTDTRTYGIMQSRISYEIKQSAISSTIPGLTQNTIQVAIGDAIYYYQQKRFFFQETTDQSTTTTAGTNVYSPPQDLIEIDRIELVDVPGQLILPLHQRTIDYILARDLAYPPEQGEPTDWAWYANQVRLYVTPDHGTDGVSNYQLKYYYRGMIPPPVNAGDQGYWMTTCELMIRSFAKGLIYDQVLKNPEKADREYKISEAQFQELLGQNNADQFTGRSESTRF